MGLVANGSTIEACSRYDEKAVGVALTKFLANVDTIKSNIGTYKENKFNGNKLLVSGLQLYKYGEPVYLLSDTSIGIEITDKFKEFNGKKALSILNEVLNKTKYKEDIIKKYKEINANTALILPFRAEDVCVINTNIKDKKIEELSTPITYLVWKVDKETSKLHAYISAHINAAELTKTYKFPLESYGKEFRIDRLLIKSPKLDTKLISMTRFGYIKPIEIESGNTKIAIDSSNMYYIDEEDTYIIGTWKKDINGNVLEETKFTSNIKTSKAYIKIKNNIDYIEKHLNLIAPYKLVESNVIKL